MGHNESSANRKMNSTKHSGKETGDLTLTINSTPESSRTKKMKKHLRGVESRKLSNSGLKLTK